MLPIRVCGIWFLGLVTLGESLIASPSSLAFFPSAFFVAFSYRFASSCLSLYSCNVFPVLVVILIAASCTEMEIGGARVHRSQISAWHAAWLCRTQAIFEEKSDNTIPESQRLARLSFPDFRSCATDPDFILLTIISYLTIIVNIIVDL